MQTTINKRQKVLSDREEMPTEYKVCAGEVRLTLVWWGRWQKEQEQLPEANSILSQIVLIPIYRIRKWEHA